MASSAATVVSAFFAPFSILTVSRPVAASVSILILPVLPSSRDGEYVPLT